MPEVSKLSIVVDADTSGAERGLDSLGTKVGSAGSSIATAFGGAALAGIAGLAAGIGASVAAAAGFEETMSAVKAVSGATGEEMQSLSGLALQLGKDTSFSASEAGKGIEELVKGGLSIPDIMGGAAKATLDLAAAGGVSLPEAATIAANALAQFNLKGEDMGHVADLIAGAANASALDVGDFSYSLKAAGAVASTVGFSFDDLAQAIAVMGKAGITGSDAGTSLKTMMLNLQPSTKAQIEEFRRLGLETTNTKVGFDSLVRMGLKPASDNVQDLMATMRQHLGLSQDTASWTQKERDAFDKLARQTGLVSNAFFDANGKVKSMAEVADILQTSMAGMTEQQKLASLEILFGSDAIRAGAVLAKEGAAGFNEMAASMGKVAAEAVGAERLNNLKGSFEQLKGSLETAAITLGMLLLPALTSLTRWATEGVNSIIPMIEGIGPAFADASAGLEPFAANLASLLGIEVADYASGWEALGDGIKLAMQELWAFIQPAVSEIAGFLVEQFGASIAWITENWPLIQKTVEAVLGAISAFWAEWGTTILAVVQLAWTVIKTAIAVAVGTILDLIKVTMQLITGDWEGAWKTVTDIFKRITDGWGTILGAAWDAIFKILDDRTGGALTKVSTWMSDTGTAIKDGWDKSSSSTSTGWGQIVDTITTSTGNALRPIVDTWNEAQRVTDTVHNAIKNVLLAVWGAIYDTVIKPKLDTISAYVSEVWETVKSNITTRLDLVKAVIDGAWTAVKTKTTEILNAVLTYVRDTIFEPIRAAVETRINAARDLVAAAWKAISDKASEILNPVLTFVRDTIFKPIQTAVETASSGVRTAFEGAVKTVSDAVNGTLQSAKSVWERTWQAIQRAAESPHQALQVIIELIDKLKRIMPDWLIPHSPTPLQVGLEGIIKAAKQMDGAFSGVSGSVGDWLRAAMKLARAPDDWLPGLSRLVSWESSGNPRAVNPESVNGEHAAGLLQTLPSTFRHYALEGMSDIFNPVHNAAAAIRYIMATYGSVYRIPGISSGDHSKFPGYASGGWAGLHGPELAMLGERGPEYVVSNAGVRSAAAPMQTHRFVIAGPDGRTLAEWHVRGREMAVDLGLLPRGAA